MRRSLVILTLLPVVCFAADGKTVVESLIRQAWEPLPVRVEWTFRGGSTTEFPDGVEWSLGNPLPTFLSGYLTLNVTGESAGAKTHSVAVSGTAKIFGLSLTPKEYIPAGSEVTLKNLIETELDWTNIADTPVLPETFVHEYRAARGLVPGRPLCERDLRRAPAVRKNHPVTLQYAQGNILIALAAEAMADGAVGDVIPVRVELENNKHYRGRVVDVNTVRFIQ